MEMSADTGSETTCSNLQELKAKIFPLACASKTQWEEKVNDIVEQTGYTKSKFAKLCGVSRVTIDKWFKGSVPKSREAYLRIGMAAGYEEGEVNHLLWRYGRYPMLYPLDLEDFVYLYVLRSGYGEEAYGKYEGLVKRSREALSRKQGEVSPLVSQVSLLASLSQMQSEEELVAFVAGNATTFSYAYREFYDYAKACIKNVCQGNTGSVYELAKGQGWSSSLRHCVSAIRQNKWYPTRNKTISLGLHLNMDRTQIDRMLRLANMEPLSKESAFETAILFALDRAKETEMVTADKMDLGHRCRCVYEVLSELEIPEADTFLLEMVRQRQ